MLLELLRLLLLPVVSHGLLILLLLLLHRLSIQSILRLRLLLSSGVHLLHRRLIPFFDDINQQTKNSQDDAFSHCRSGVGSWLGRQMHVIVGRAVKARSVRIGSRLALMRRRHWLGRVQRQEHVLFFGGKFVFRNRISFFLAPTLDMLGCCCCCVSACVADTYAGTCGAAAGAALMCGAKSSASPEMSWFCGGAATAGGGATAVLR